MFRPDRLLTTLLALTAASLGHAAPPTAPWHDSLDDPAAWSLHPADGVELSHLAETDASRGVCTRLDYRFVRGAGYGIIRRDFADGLTLPENFRVRFQLRGQGPRNTLEIKLVQKDPDGGENVWWVNQRDYDFEGAWREVVLPRRKFEFAWGPSGGKDGLNRIDAIEIVITSFNGGAGSVWLDELAIEPLPAVKPYTGTPSVTVSSRGDGGDGPLALNAEGFLGWHSGPLIEQAQPSATIDFGEARELGGLVLEWDAHAAASHYTLEAEEADAWRAIVRVTGGNGGRDYLATPGLVTQRLRLRCEQLVAGATAVGLRSVRVMPPEFGDTPNEQLKVMAADAPRGWYPRYWLGEAWYWNVVGADSDTAEALISEDGAIEIGKSGPSIEPFIISTSRLLTWNESTCSQSLEDGYLPISTVRREWSLRAGEMGLRLDITAFADDAPPMKRGEGVVFIRYLLTNTGVTAHVGTLAAAVRPMQVNPTYQFLNTTGGWARVRSARVEKSGSINVDGRLIQSLTPATVRLFTLDAGESVEHLAALAAGNTMAASPDPVPVEDARGMASAALTYPFDLGPGQSMHVHLAVPLHPERGLPLALDEANSASTFDTRLAAVKREWTEKLNRVSVSLPGDAQPWWNAVRSNLAYILINKDGAGIQPGSRSYERTWIRDGSLTSAAMLSLGHEEDVRAFIDWFAPYQYDNGKIPCCVDRRGSDPVPEHDSHGQYIYAVMNLYRFTGDAAFLRRHWDRVKHAVAYIEALRAERMTAEFSSPTASDEKRSFYGLMPESISHEGYSAKPMHSYWDDLFTLKGLSDAAEMALIIGEDAEASRLAALRDSFRQTLYASMNLAMKRTRIDYLPGCAELGDFDATSTTVGLWPCDELGLLPEPALRNTFERYWKFVVDRRAAAGEQANWTAYTPYEWRTVGTMIRLGKRDRAHEIADYFFNDSRPAGWNHWAEVVWRDARKPNFIGDMPHTWVGSDFINSFVSMLAISSDRNQTLVLGAGLPREWLLTGDGVKVERLRTEYGQLSYTARRDAGGEPGARVVYELAGGLHMPAGGLFVAPPDSEHIARVRVDGDAAKVSGGLIRVPRCPARIEVEYGP